LGGEGEEGNLFTVPSNKFAEFNFFLDPKAAKTVVGSSLDITVIPLRAQRQVSSFGKVLRSLGRAEKTPELSFVYRLLLLMKNLQKKHQAYSHIVSWLYSSVLTAIGLVHKKYQSIIKHSIAVHMVNNSQEILLLLIMSSSITKHSESSIHM
jgi:inosine-uridine nucleoside N-ribohydrolase